MTKAATPSSTTAPYDDQLLAWEKERSRLAELTEATHGEDNIAKLCDATDVINNLIRHAPCATRTAAVLKLQSLARDISNGGDRVTSRPSSDVIGEVIDWLRAEPAEAATPEELGALFDTTEMPTVSMNDGLVPPQSEWDALGLLHLPHMRLAWATMSKTKPELLELARTLFDDDFGDLTDRIEETAEYFGALAQLATSANARLVMAGAKLVVDEHEDAR